MSYKIIAPRQCSVTIKLPASKSISNRALILNALSNSSLQIGNLSDCDDTRVMLKAFTSTDEQIDICAAGTSMRFLTAYLSQQPGNWHITGSNRMKQRPIGLLVEALQKLGADISYAEKEGFPPLHIRGKQLTGGTLILNGGVSSQYISALLMVAPTMENGLQLTLSGEIISRPYIEMTLKLMRQFGVNAAWTGNDRLVVPHQSYQPVAFSVESDWSGASYWYEIAALSDCCKLELLGLNRESTQGDARIAAFFEPLGVSTSFTPNGVILSKQESSCRELRLDLSDQPDLAQTLAVTCALKNIPFHLTGLQSLKIKETDRIEALKRELAKLGYLILDKYDSELLWLGERCNGEERPAIDTYEDHRMAMAFAPVSLARHEIVINHPEVVSKSYPAYWRDLKLAGFTIEEI